MTVEKISWSISAKECCRTGASNSRPPDHQSSAHPTELLSLALAHLSQKHMMSFCDRLMYVICALSVSQQFVKKSSSSEPPGKLTPNFTGMILGWPPFKIVQRNEFHSELWLPWQPKGKTWEIFLSKTSRRRASVFGRWHHLMVLYQNCSNYTPGMKRPHPGSPKFYMDLYWKKNKKSSGLKPQDRGLWYLQHCLGVLY